MSPAPASPRPYLYHILFNKIGYMDVLVNSRPLIPQHSWSVEKCCQECPFQESLLVQDAVNNLQGGSRHWYAQAVKLSFESDLFSRGFRGEGISFPNFVGRGPSQNRASPGTVLWPLLYRKEHTF